MKTTISFCLALIALVACPDLARAQACGSYTLGIGGTWQPEFDRLTSVSTTERSAFW